jgi:hypothetical protein
MSHITSSEKLEVALGETINYKYYEQCFTFLLTTIPTNDRKRFHVFGNNRPGDVGTICAAARTTNFNFEDADNQANLVKVATKMITSRQIPSSLVATRIYFVEKMDGRTFVSITAIPVESDGLIHHGDERIRIPLDQEKTSMYVASQDGVCAGTIFWRLDDAVNSVADHFQSLISDIRSYVMETEIIEDAERKAANTALNALLTFQKCPSAKIAKELNPDAVWAKLTHEQKVSLVKKLDSKKGRPRKK